MTAPYKSKPLPSLVKAKLHLGYGKSRVHSSHLIGEGGRFPVVYRAYIFHAFAHLVKYGRMDSETFGIRKRVKKEPYQSHENLNRM